MYTIRTWALAASAALCCLSVAAAEPAEAKRLRERGEALIQKAFLCDAPGPLYTEAMEELFAAKELLVNEIEAGRGDAAALEAQIENLNSMIFFCHRNQPVSEAEDSTEDAAKPSPEPVSDVRARELYELAVAYEKTHPDATVTVLSRYFEVAEKSLGSAWSLKAQRRALDVQRKLLASGAEPARPVELKREVEPAAPQRRVSPAPVVAAAPPPTPPSLAEQLAGVLHCRAKDLSGGRVELVFDFEDVRQGQFWTHYHGEWHISDEKLSGFDRSKKTAANNWLMVDFEGDVKAVVQGMATGPVDGINVAIHASGNTIGYGVALGDRKNRTLRGFRNLTFTRSMSIRSGKSYRIELSLKKHTITYKLGGKTLFKTSDPAPLVVGRLRLSTNGRAVFNTVKVVGKPTASWLSKHGIRS